MVERKSADQRPRLWRSIVLCTVFVSASGLGMFLARPLTAQFRTSSPWVLPAIIVGVLTILVIVALIVLPKITLRKKEGKT
jgi:membrane protein CcdC involved in cytochrome C biogenesis